MTTQRNESAQSPIDAAPDDDARYFRYHRYEAAAYAARRHGLCLTGDARATWLALSAAAVRLAVHGV